MEILSAVLLTVFAVIGIVFTVRELSMWLFSGRKKRSVLLISDLGDENGAEQELRAAITRARWGGGRAVCVADELDERTKTALRKICREEGAGELISKEELMRLIADDGAII